MLKKIYLILIVFFNYNIYNTQLTCAFAVQPANCNPALPRVTSGILAQYNLNDSSYDPSTLVANNQFLNTFGSISNLALTDSSLWCTTSAGLCFNTGRSNSMGAFSQLFSPSTFGELSLSSGDFTTEVWFVASKNTGGDLNGLIWAIAGFGNDPSLTVNSDSATSCNSYEYFGTRQPGMVPVSLNSEYLRPGLITACSTTPFALPIKEYYGLHQLVVVVNHFAPVAYVSVYLDNVLVATSSLQPKTWSTPTQLYLGPSYKFNELGLLLLSRWDGSIHLVAFYGLALTPTQLNQNFIGILPDNPIIAQSTVMNRTAGTSVLSIFNINLYSFSQQVVGCNVTLGLTVLTLPKLGHLIVQILGTGPGPTTAWNAIGLVPFNIPNLNATALAFIPAYPQDFGLKYVTFTYQGYNAADSQPPTEPIIATATVNIFPIDLPPTPINQTYYPYPTVPVTVTLLGTTPNNSPERIIFALPRTIVAGYILSLPTQGSLCFLNVTNVTSIIRTTCKIITIAQLPFRVSTGSFVNYTSEPTSISMSGLSPIFTDSFLFKVSDGTLNSSIPGQITIEVQNPLITFPSLTVTQQVRTEQLSRIILQGIDINYPQSVIDFNITVLPTAGNLLYDAGHGAGPQIVTQATLSSLPLFSSNLASLPIFYQPFLLTAGYNADSIGLLIVNSTNHFIGGPQIHYFFVNDPGVFILTNATINALVEVPTYITIGYVNGAQNTAVLVQDQFSSGFTLQWPILFSMTIVQLSGGISFAHPEVWKNVTIVVGGMAPIATAQPEIKFYCTRTVLNLLLSNVTIVMTANINQIVTFSATDVNQASGITYTTNGKISYAVTLPPFLEPAEGAPLIPQYGLYILYIGGPILGILLILVCIYAICLGMSLNRTLGVETKMQKKQDKQMKKDQRQTEKLIKKNKKEIDQHTKIHRSIHE